MASKKDDAQAQADELAAQETEKGFRGIGVDPTPNENYTLAGVTAGKPTPETDEKARKAAADASADVSRNA